MDRNKLDPLGDEVDTRDVLARVRQPNALELALLGLSDRIPANPDASLSLANMLKAGLGTAGRWVGGNPEIGRDTLAPFGMGLLSPLTGLRAMEHPTAAAMRSKGRTFEGPTHANAILQGEDHLGKDRFWSGVGARQNSGKVYDGFVTSEGRLVGRPEAAALMSAATNSKSLVYGEANSLQNALAGGVKRVNQEPNSFVLY